MISTSREHWGFQTIVTVPLSLQLSPVSVESMTVSLSESHTDLNLSFWKSFLCPFGHECQRHVLRLAKNEDSLPSYFQGLFCAGCITRCVFVPLHRNRRRKTSSTCTGPQSMRGVFSVKQAAGCLTLSRVPLTSLCCVRNSCSLPAAVRFPIAQKFVGFSKKVVLPAVLSPWWIQGPRCKRLEIVTEPNFVGEEHGRGTIHFGKVTKALSCTGVKPGRVGDHHGHTTRDS